MMARDVPQKPMHRGMIFIPLHVKRALIRTHESVGLSFESLSTEQSSFGCLERLTIWRRLLGGGVVVRFMCETDECGIT